MRCVSSRFLNGVAAALGCASINSPADASPLSCFSFRPAARSRRAERIREGWRALCALSNPPVYVRTHYLDSGQRNATILIVGWVQTSLISSAARGENSEHKESVWFLFWPSGRGFVVNECREGTSETRNRSARLQRDFSAVRAT